MTPKIKNIIIFSVIAIALGLAAFYIISSQSSSQPNLASATTSGAGGSDTSTLDTLASSQKFLTLLLSTNNIKLNVSIFDSVAFNSLTDTPIDLSRPPKEMINRPNPFAQLGNDEPAPGTGTTGSGTSTGTGATTTDTTGTGAAITP